MINKQCEFLISISIFVKKKYGQIISGKDKPFNRDF